MTGVVRALRGKLTVFACMLMLGLATAAPAGAVTVVHGRLAPSGIAEIGGKMPKGHAFRAASFVLSHDRRYSRHDVVLGARVVKATKHHFKAWVSLPDVVGTGRYKLLACRRGKPSHAKCVSVGGVRVRLGPSVPSATPALDTARAMTASFDLQGGDMSVTAADGTSFTLTIPSGSVPSLELTMTPVTALTPASAVGQLVDGVMIEPLGSAPAGSTLEIRRGMVPAGARAVAFGGVDPSGGAFPLPVPVTTDTRIAVMAFGGYAVAVPASGRAADVKARAVPCQSPPPSAHAAAAAPPPDLMDCIAVAQRLRAMSDAARSSGTALDLAFQAASQELAGEISKVTSLPPTDEGDAELQLLLQLATGIGRQATLADLPPSATAALNDPLRAAFSYHLNKLRSICMGSAQHSSELYLEYAYEAFFDIRQITAFGGPTGDIDAIFKACFDRIKLQFTGNDDATVDNGAWTEHVVVSAVATVTGSDQGLVADPPALTFKTASSQADPSFASAGGSATTTSSSGKMYGEPFGFDATRRVICKNKKLSVERHAYLTAALLDLWDDTEQVTLSMNGFSQPGNPSSAAADSWLNDYYSKQQRTKLEIGGDQDKRADSGKCTTIGCQTFSFDASLQATALVN